MAGSLLFPKSLPSLQCRRGIVGATISAPRVLWGTFSLPKLSSRGLVEESERRNGCTLATTTLLENDSNLSSQKTQNYSRHNTKSSDPKVIAKLFAIMEAVADRVEMHKNIGEQRDNWNHLLLTSINAMTLTAATIAGLEATIAAGPPLKALKLSSTGLYIAATGFLVMMNKIQPSQLAEEQRNAARLFKQLHGQIQTTLSLGKPDIDDVNEAMDKVLALDKAYPLPLLDAMLEKFPSKVEPARWWPQQKRKHGLGGKIEGNNGWNRKLEEEMRQVVGVLEKKDLAEYTRLGGKALKLNKFLAISGPLLTVLGALGSSFVGTTHSSWPEMMGIIVGAMATVVNSMEHGGQVGMVFEMYRSNASFFKLIEESIMSNTNKKDVERRENGELLEMKVALQLGRSISELNHLAAAAAASSTRNMEVTEEFASKLF
ncbi:probable F-box protein At4g22030 [Durio zibethinus]|uniref:Probable F-box protein At4g22030 n=1 Tax=Durio zibethinus TaxID=66656 RepID=A0A6P6BJX9_DURZI|nr:probable F-box protein At4g22030 [Durio zibethinus]